MKKQILITGGLGYIGYELCKIYSGSSWQDRVVVIDKNFASERVKQLTEWNIEFYQGDILDQNFIRRFVPNADIIHHLAGITNVAYVKSDQNLERDNLIKNTAINGTNNILELMRTDAKIIFPSTHVVFDGLKKTEKLIKETRKKKPTLAYSKSKSQNEDDIIKSGKNYVILRLASVYGFSTDSTRIQIVPNLFSKITAENGTIKLFGKGVQLKSLVSLIDVARCFKYVEENNKVNKEIFHISKENLTIKDIALKCPQVVLSMISPGAISVPGKFLNKIETEDPILLKKMIAEINIPANRLGKISEVTELLLFLCSNRSSYMHGSHIEIDGGASN
jgi:nucleoside-diphosphate-sugar epimerase